MTLLRDWLIPSAYLAWAGACLGIGIGAALVTLAAVARMVGGM